MSTYIALANWTPEGIRALGNAAARLDAIKKLMADMDCQYRSMHMTMGEYDFVLIYDAPDDAVAARLTLQIAKKGFVRTKTLNAFPEPAFREIVKSMA
ncbi:MAG: GYD domain-containing protein [Hyphomicrobiales bacterium]|nr:GYD domain-containing protein [Hyphomicrobiales bacterium]